MLIVNSKYKLKEDLEFLLESENFNTLEFSKITKVSRVTLDEIISSGDARSDVYEKIYAYAYEHGYRINSVKEELLKEQYPIVLFHGSKQGLSEISINGSRANCDFGNGFYLGESYDQALSFVYANPKSAVYSFSFSFDDLTVKKFDCSLEWMLAICYYRGSLEDYSDVEMVKNIILDIEGADLVIAPIADNKMFYVMSQFTDGDINADAALHSLSASKLGLQYIIKTERALNRLSLLEKYYLSRPEREDCGTRSMERGFEIDTKLKLAKREFRTGPYIEEILK